MKSANTSSFILRQILSEAESYNSQGRPFLAAFDLDSTLFDLTLRIIKIISEFAREEAARFPTECSALEKIEILPTDWGIAESLSRKGITQASHPEFFREVHDSWAAKFFSGDYLHHDEPLPGAVEYVNRLKAAGATIMYLTGRDIPRMLEGTERTLRAAGLPVDKSSLFLKPLASMDDARFKVDVLKEALLRFDRIWLFENEPVNTNLVAKECPEVGLVFIESTHSGREQPDAAMARIVDFRDAEDGIRAPVARKTMKQ